MAGTRSKAHAEAIGTALKQRFLDRQDSELLQRMIALYVGGKTIAETAAIVGKPPMTTHRWLKGAGVEIRKSSDGKKGGAWSAARRAATPSKQVAPRPIVNGVALFGYDLLSFRAIGNRSIDGQGYVVIRIGRGERQYEHILVAQSAIGRRLRRGEVVHHINCVRHDNRPENLLVCTRAYHQALHARMKRDPYWSQVEADAKALRQQSSNHHRKTP